MATHTSKSTTQVTTAVVSGKVTTVTTPTGFFQVYSVGDTVSYNYKGRSLPCIVVAIKTTGSRAADGTNVTYTLHGDFTGTSTYPAGAPRGPFVAVPVSALTDR